MTAVLASLSISREAANKAVDFIELLLSPKLPAELVDSTEALLVRLQAVTRLANLLCPPFPCKDGDVHKKGRKWQPLLLACHVLCCVMPCCALSCHAMLCCAVQCCAVLWSRCVMLCCAALNHVVVCAFALCTAVMLYAVMQDAARQSTYIDLLMLVSRECEQQLASKIAV